MDWKVRESFHTIEYLNRQDISRDTYEIIWIEFYNYLAKPLLDIIDGYKVQQQPLPIDRFIVLEYPDSFYYHKHVMYNIGLLHARGDIVVIMDSDAIIKTDFIGCILKEFEKNQDTVLCIEEIRNFNRDFYPFSYPSLEEVLGDGITMPYEVKVFNKTEINLGESVISLKDNPNLIHVYNYGACLCVRRDHLIAIGGADEHIDYLGHVCGPYDMIFRLINAGFQDRLHPTCFLYHVYHPHQGGTDNYLGPNNGRGISTTALANFEQGRVLPLKENEEIKKLRTKGFFPKG
ncbi:MAG: glycosyltransferase [Nitrospirae bacterium]|nr:glycosyltransferase [Nitrospirota bacterium]